MGKKKILILIAGLDNVFWLCLKILQGAVLFNVYISCQFIRKKKFVFIKHKIKDQNIQTQKSNKNVQKIVRYIKLTSTLYIFEFERIFLKGV